MADVDRDTEDQQRFRLRILGVVAVSLVAALLARLWYLQVLRSEDLAAAATANVLRSVHEEAPRGRIFDRQGRLLVDNEVIRVVMIDRRELNAALDDSEQEEMLLELALLLSESGDLIKVSEIRSRLADPEYGPFELIPIAFGIDLDLFVYLGERPDLFPGVSVEQRTLRTYPYGQLASHVLGYVGSLTASEYEIHSSRIDESQPDAKIYKPNDRIGKTGVERIFENDLRGVPGRRVYEVNSYDEVVRELDDLSRDPVPGNDVYLTIDIDVQRLVEDELRRGLDEARGRPKESEEDLDPVAAAGAAVAMDPRDGSVLAMASYPTYDPREFVGGISPRLFETLTSEQNFSPILNRAIQGQYPPGSTFKLVTAYAGLTQGVISDGGLIAVDEFHRDTGTYRYPYCLEETDTTCVFESPYCCSRGVDLRDAITVSSDTYFYRVGGEGFFRRPEPQDEGIQDSARLFGFGGGTGVALPYERSGVVPDRDYFDLQFERGVFGRGGNQWYAGDTINLAIGQGDMLVTPLQMANAYAAVAAGGRLHQPNIASRVVDRDGNVLKSFEPRVRRQLVWPREISDPLIDGMNGVTAYNLPSTLDEGYVIRGTAFEAFNLPLEGGVDFPLESWPVAGKTGTAEQDGEADTAWFVAFGPAPWPERGLVNEPEVVVAVVLEEAGFGGVAAAPVASRIMLPIASDAVPRSRTAVEIEACYAEVATLAVFFEGVRTGEIKVDEEGNPISEVPPELSEKCQALVGGEEAVAERGLDALQR